MICIKQDEDALVCPINWPDHPPAAQLNIRSVPTMALFRWGKEVARQSGAMSGADIVRWVKSPS